jgi:predicted PurR-regulated permease PerM
MNENTQTVHSMTTTSSKPRSWALNVIAVGVILALVYLGQLVLVTLLGSILLAFILAPVVEFLIQFKLHRSLAAFIAVVLLLAVIYGLTYVSYSHAESFLANLPKYSQQIRDVLGRFRQQAEDIQRSTDFIPPSSDDKNVLKVRPLPTWSDALSHGFTSVSDILLATTFIPFLVYFMLSWRSHVRSATVMLFPMQHRHTAFVTLGLIGKMMRAFILGNLIVGLFMSVLSVAIFWALKIPFFYFIGFISGFVSLIPYMGVLLAIAPPLAVGVGQISSADAFLIVISVVLLHVFALNVLYPMILGKRLQLNPLALTISLLFWGWMWGAIGLILAIPITGTMKIIFDHVESMKPYAAWLGE